MSALNFLKRNRFQHDGRGRWSPGLFVALLFLVQCTLTPFHVHLYVNHQDNHPMDQASGTCCPTEQDSENYETCEHSVCQGTLSCCSVLLGQYLGSIQVPVQTENLSSDEYETEGQREDLVEGDSTTIINPAARPYAHPSLLAPNLRAPPQA